MMDTRFLLLWLQVVVLCAATSEHHHEPRVQVNNDNVHHTHLYQHHAEPHQKLNTNSRVLELSDRFLDIVNTPISAHTQEPRYQPWLVKFYAPWCGHCKRLEPVFNHVAQALHNTAIRVGKVDCTRFPAVGTEFKIHGYPTIMFIAGPNRKHTFQGDRTLENIVKFANRMNAPAVQTSSTPLQQFIDTLPRPAPPPSRQKRHEPTTTTHTTQKPPEPQPAPEDQTDLFFGLLRPKDVVTDLVLAFRGVAQRFQQHSDFFEFSDPRPPTPIVFAYKHGRLVKYVEQDTPNVTQDLEAWIGNERFPDFMQITRGNLIQLFHESSPSYNWKDLIVSAVVEEDKLHRVVGERENALLNILRGVTANAVKNTVATKSPVDLGLSAPVTSAHVTHHYSWIGNPGLANSIVAEHLSLPSLLIIARSPSDNEHRYYVFSDWEQIDSESKIENLVELVREGHFTPTVYANSWKFKLYRYAFDAKVSLTDMWVGNPVLTIVLFGLPMGFLSLILYSVCCGDILDAKESDDELPLDDSDEEHEKRE